ncbi:MAG TPA: hypothetical protein VGY98_16820 [Verrucomicrobiae bacterium]|nr:hypothetical protein [Verrucomicrobiae bacterium]
MNTCVSDTFFRNAYSFDLDWQKMSPLVLCLEETLQKLEKALDDFLKHGAAN